MTEKELKKLHRSDLLELLIAQEKENEQLRSQIAQLEARLADRTIAIDQAGSIAEASLQINGVFQAAQNAAAKSTGTAGSRKQKTASSKAGGRSTGVKKTRSSAWTSGQAELN